MTDRDDVRAELSTIAASLRAYLEWQADTGAVGIPRGTSTPSTRVGGVGIANEGAHAHAERSTANADANAAPVEAPPLPTPLEAPVVAAPPAVAAPPEAAATATRDALPPASLTSRATTIAPATAQAPAPALDVDRHTRLPVLAREVASCTKCGLATTRTKTVFARGNADASLCFVGEAPGADEDAQGVPFVGRAGQLLDKMIGAMGLDPQRDVYICNILKCRPPDNRRPTPEESETCISYLHEQLALVRPKVIVTLGNTAVAALLGTKLGITKLRGQWKLYRGATLVMPTYHPSYLIRPSAQQAEAKRQAWEDLQAVMRELGLPPPKGPRSA
jgi:DNA polymerase